MDESEYYDPSRREKKDMTDTLLEFIRKKYPLAHRVKGALHPTIQIDVPKRVTKKGVTHYTTYSISIN